MENTKMTVARKLRELRTAKNLTQTELAQMLNYSDKAISKWERGESMPDVSVLVRLADLYGVTMDELIRDVRPATPAADSEAGKRIQRALILGMCLLLVLLIATFIFVVLVLTKTALPFCWLCFVYAVPVSAIVWLVLNSIWFSQRKNFLIVSLLMWSVLAAIYLTLLPMGYNIWLIFVLGIPGQIIIFLWSGLHKKR